MIKPINFKYDNVWVSEKAFLAHVELYKNYCFKYNEIQKELETYSGCPDADKNYSRYRGMKKEEAHNLNASILHEQFFQNLSKSNTSPGNHFIELIKPNFDSFDNWRRDFISCAKASRGWAVVCYEQRSQSIKNNLIDGHDKAIMLNSYPLLVLDLFEHSYIIDYGNNIDIYINRFFQNIDWNVVENRSKVVAE